MEKEILEENIYYYKNIIPDPKKFVEIIEATENEDYGTSLTKGKSGPLVVVKCIFMDQKKLLCHQK